MSATQNQPFSLEEIEAEISAATPEAIPTGKEKKPSKLKSTPHIEPTEAEKQRAAQMQNQIAVENNLTEIEKVMKLYNSYSKVETTLNSLKAFKHKKDNEDDNYGASTIVITDSKRNEFKTQNPRLVEALTEALTVILETKKTELGLEIKALKIAA